MITHSISRAATRMPSLRTSIAALIAGVAFVLPGAARADTTCTHDSDCSKGFTCEVSAVYACPPIAPCPSGQICATPGDCTKLVHSCQLAPCTTDADCAPDMVCHGNTYNEWSWSDDACGTAQELPLADGGVLLGPTVQALADGGVPPCVLTCTTVTGPTECLPKYELPCKVNADCGDHFTCVPDTSTTRWASGSGGSAPGTGAGYPSSANSSSSAGSTVASPPVTTSPPDQPVDAGAITPPPLEAVDGGSAPTSGCTTTTLTTSSCVADSIVCMADSDCPATWTCEGSAISNGPNIACAQPALIVDGAPVTVPCEFDGGEAPPTPRTCQPPYGYYAAPGATLGAPGGFPLSASADAGVPGTNGGGGTPTGGGTGAAGSGENSASSGATAATPSAATTENGSASAGNAMDSGGGCEIGASPAGGAAGSLWTLVGLVGLALRRRPRATR
jgi:hypothetical protein